MFSQCPMLAKTTTIILVLWACLPQLIAAQPDQPTPNSEPQVICRPFGTCEPCPEDALHEPFCKPFGNRRLMHCTSVTTTEPSSSHSPEAPSPDQPPTQPNIKVPPKHHSVPSHPPPPNPHALEGETPAWESCGRIPEKEREDFWEFVACNVFFAAISLFVLFARSKRLQTLKGRQLAARIGLVRGDGGDGGL